MREIKVTASTDYSVKIGRGLLPMTGEALKTLGGATRAAIISDDTVFALYGETVRAALESAGFTVCRFTFPHGEQSKSLENFAEALSFLARNRLSRRDIVVALGGGVTGDLAGFTSACYLRGVRCVQLPTTLLAAVDSSVGGKTAVDLPEGKNLCGAFHQPSLVLCDCDTLQSLPAETFADGCGEVIKYGMLGSPELIAFLQAHDVRDSLEEVIAACVRMKRDIVTEDEFDTGRRRLLNFGHTVGHAVEALSGFTLTHGRAVAVGMAIVTRAAVRRGVCGGEVYAALEGLLVKNGLPSRTDFAAAELYAQCLSDKKVEGGTVDLIVPVGLGTCEIRRLPLAELREWIELGL